MKLTLEISKKNFINEITIFLYMVLIELVVAWMSTSFRTIMFYFVIIDLCVLLAWVTQKSSRISFFIVSAAISTFIFGFRESRVDDISYMDIFSNVQSAGVINTFRSTRMEPGYLLFNKVVSLFTSNYTVLRVVCAILFIAIFYISIYTLREYISLPIAVLIFHTYLYFSMLQSALVRISIAVGISALGFYWLMKKKIWCFVIVVLIAALIHYSALICLLFLPFLLFRGDEEKIFRRSIIGYIVIVPLAMIFIARFIMPFLGSRYSAYASIRSINITISAFDILPIFIVGLFCINQLKEYMQRRLYYILMAGTLLSTIWSVFSSMVSMGRAIYYFGISSSLMLGMIDKLQKDESLRKFIFQAGIVTYAILYVAFTKFLNVDSIEHLIPYMNVFFEI